jgi:hypothetical protein
MNKILLSGRLCMAEMDFSFVAGYIYWYHILVWHPIPKSP